MSRKRRTERENVINQAIEQAPFEQLIRGLGISEKEKDDLQQMSEQIAGEILNAIDTELLPEESLLTIRSIVSKNIEPLLEKGIQRAAKKMRRNRDVSMIDSRTLGLTTDESISKFLNLHGVDLNNPEDFKYLIRIFNEAVQFLEEEVLIKNQKVHSEIKKIKTKTDIFRIFKYSAGQCPKIKGLISQACAVLRIAASINFMERDPVISALPYAEEQLKNIMDKHIKRQRVEGEKIIQFIPKPGDIPILLERAEMRTKDRRQVIKKLLHKPSNRAEEVLDHIGLRFIAKTPIDALSLIYHMFFHPETSILPSATIRVSESKNLILDAEKVILYLNNPEKAHALVSQLAQDTIDHEELSSIVQSDSFEQDNEFSLPSYRAIHITIDLPIHIISKDGERCCVHFPIEIQILDLESAVINQKKAPHGEYKRRQSKDIRDRAMKNNLEDLPLNTKTRRKSK